MEVVRNYILKNLYVHGKLPILFCTVLLPGASEVDQTHKFYDILDLIQFFHIWSDSVLIEMNDVNNFICNNFAYNNSWRYTVFPLGTSKVD